MKFFVNKFVDNESGADRILTTANKDFDACPTRKAAKAYQQRCKLIILKPSQTKAKWALENKEDLADEAKENQGTRNDLKDEGNNMLTTLAGSSSNSKPSDGYVRTRLAQQAGVSRRR